MWDIEKNNLGLMSHNFLCLNSMSDFEILFKKTKSITIFLIYQHGFSSQRNNKFLYYYNNNFLFLEKETFLKQVKFNQLEMEIIITKKSIQK